MELPVFVPRIRTLWDDINTSLWFMPALLSASAVLLAVGCVAADARLELGGSRTWWVFSGTQESASRLLASLLTAMITMATVAISITMVVLTLAAGQLGPRLIRSFMADKRTQLMLGFFLATIIYVVLVLRTVNQGLGQGGVPHLAVTVGTAVVLVSVILLVFFIHHLARSIVADDVISRVGRALDGRILAFLPSGLDGAGRAPVGATELRRGAELRTEHAGYVQAIDYEAIVHCAARSGALVALRHRPGHHVIPGEVLARVDPDLTDALRGAILDSVVIGPERTPTQDIEFAVRQLVEVALRALSPSLNDAFTAIAVIDRLSHSLAHVMGRGMPSGAWHDRNGRVRVIAPVTDFRGIVDAAFNQIRQAGERHPAVLIRLLTAIAKLGEQARDDEHRRVLRDHFTMAAELALSGAKQEYDRCAVVRRVKSAPFGAAAGGGGTPRDG